MQPSTLIALDTNVLVRYLAQDDALQSALATQLIEPSPDNDKRESSPSTRRPLDGWA